MEFGLVLPTERSVGRDPSQAWGTIERQAKMADRGEFDSLWVGEHHFTEHIYFDNLQTLSLLAGITDDVKLGTGVCLAPLYNPIRLAERIANLDVQDGGRTILGLGLGYREEEFEVMGIDKRRRVPRLLETLEILPRAWAGEAFSHDGPEFNFERITVNPEPVQEGGPPIWLGGKAPAAFRRAAEFGDAWLPAPSCTRSELESCIDVYDDACEDRPSVRPCWREVFVAEERGQAIDQAKRPLVEKYESYASWGSRSETHDPKSLDERFEEIRDGRFIIGTPEEVIREIEAYREDFGVDHLITRMQWPGMDDEAAETSMRLFQDEVAPAFR